VTKDARALLEEAAQDPTLDALMERVMFQDPAGLSEADLKAARKMWRLERTTWRAKE
jgi:hypothetical protein